MMWNRITKQDQIDTQRDNLIRLIDEKYTLMLELEEVTEERGRWRAMAARLELERDRARDLAAYLEAELMRVSAERDMQEDGDA